MERAVIKSADHPRIRGEHGAVRQPLESGPGSSPHTRGAHVHRGERVVLQRIIPAYAGSTSRAPVSCRQLWDHPRIRGEHRQLVAERCAFWGSSPHTRGAPDRRRAGCRRAPDHPRIRGEHLRGFLEVPGYGGSSPHTRGAPWNPVHDILRRRIIPAYAGSTSTCARPRIPRKDHPRIRGEHDGLTGLGLGGIRIIPAYAGSTRHRCGRLVRRLGSSPHTRGAPAKGYPAVPFAGIIPAYAGSTS